MSIKADPDGSPTEQVRARVGWHLTGLAIARPDDRGAMLSEVRCDACVSADWERSRTGLWCSLHAFATRVTATCHRAAKSTDTAQAALIRACAQIEQTPPGRRTAEDRAALTAMYTDLGVADPACHDGRIPGDDA